MQLSVGIVFHRIVILFSHVDLLQLKFIPIVYKELIIHRIKKEFNHKELLVLLVMA